MWGVCHLHTWGLHALKLYQILECKLFGAQHDAPQLPLSFYTHVQDFSVNVYQCSTNIMLNSIILNLPHDGGELRFTKCRVLVCGGFALCDLEVCGRIRISSSSIESHSQDELATEEWTLLVELGLP